MPKITKKRRNHPLRAPISLVVIAIILVGAVLIYRHYHGKSSLASTNSSQTSSSPYSAAPPADNIPNNERKTNSNPSPTLENPLPATTTSGSFTIQIVNAQVNNSNVHVGTLVSGITSGSCSLSATQSGQSTLRLGTSSVVADVNDYDCGVFNIATSQFPTPGTWELTLTVTNNGASSSGNANVVI